MSETQAGIDVLVSEVGPRDGLQSIKRPMATPAKLDWIRALAGAGLREIEVGSFVSPKLLPQMADTGDVVREAIEIRGLTVLALVPNLKGAERAIEAGTPKLTMPISASRAHSLQNIGKTPEEAIEEVRKVAALRDSLPAGQRPFVEVGVSTAFGCTIEGPVSEDWVLRMAVLLAEAGADSVGLSDTTGYANPEQVKRMFAQLRASTGRQSGRRASAQHARSGTRQRGRGAGCGRHHVRFVARWLGRLSVRARRHRQHRDRRSRVHARVDGALDRHRYRQA